MSASTPRKFIVTGAGLGGALMAGYLARAGHTVEIYERRDDPRGAGKAEGRSINLAISTRGIHALAGLGLDTRILEQAVPMRGRMMHGLDGSVTFQRYGTEEHHTINSVSRAGLNRALIEAAAEQPGVELFFGRKCAGADLDGGKLFLEDTRTGERTVAEGDVIVGADGAFSGVRRAFMRLDRFDYRQDYLEHGYKELTIPPDPDGGFRMERNALHIWPRGGYMMIALPNRDGSFTCTLFWPYEGPNSFAEITNQEKLLRFFRKSFPDAVPDMPDLAKEFFANPTGSLVTVRCSPWFYRDRAVLLGDACHAVVPFYGQGANASFEDCVVLDECLRDHGDDLETAFAEYHRQRKVNVDALADLALGNFIEMRDHVASRGFLLKKKLGQTLHRLMPRGYLPMYSMVTFSRIPYAEAVARNRRQNRRLAWTGTAILALVLILILVALANV
jgi:kynurenine 3-monooxygenase